MRLGLELGLGFRDRVIRMYKEGSLIDSSMEKPIIATRLGLGLGLEDS
jgi:hypothetical protein